jgi:hypothetical protein
MTVSGDRVPYIGGTRDTVTHRLCRTQSDTVGHRRVEGVCR